MRMIVAVENVVLRHALLVAIAPLDCQPELLLPDALLQSELAGCVFILLETSDDVERLVNTATQLYARWGETGKADIHILSYSTAEVTPDSVVFRLWSIGPEMTVIVQAWEPKNIQARQCDAHALTKRLLEHEVF